MADPSSFEGFKDWLLGVLFAAVAGLVALVRRLDVGEIQPSARPPGARPRQAQGKKGRLMPYPSAPVDLIRQELPAPVLVNNLVLAGAAETATKPTVDPVSGESVVITWLWIAATADCYMRFDGTAVVPAADITDGTGSFPLAAGNGLLLNVKNRASVSVIGTGVVGLFWLTDRG